jgi:hypothetical protein
MVTLGCDMPLEIVSPSRGSFGSHLMPAVTVYMDACDKPTLCDQLLDSFVTSDDACCGPKSAGKGSCPNGFPRACDEKCAPKVMMFYGACGGDVWNTTHPQGEDLQDVEGVCYSALVAVAAKAGYELLADSFDVPLALWILTAVPFFFFLFLAFFGRQIATIFRCVTGFLATCLPLLIPAVVPYFNACGYSVGMDGMDAGCEDVPPFTAMVFVQLFMSVYVGCLGGYVSAKNPNFGNMIQGILLAYVLVVETSDFWMPLVDPNMMGFLDWVLLGAVTVLGIVIGTLNVLLPDTLTIIASSTIGIFMSMQIFCVIGMFNNWFWTFQVSVIAMILGAAGCTITGCWVHLGFWILMTILGIFTQFKAGVAESIHEKEDISSFDLYIHKIATMFHTLMDLEKSMAKLSDYHSPEEFAVLAEKNAQIYAQVTTFIFDFMILVVGVAGVVGVGEGVVRKIVPDKAGGILLSMAIFLNSLVAVLVTLYEIRIHQMVEGTSQDDRRKKFDRYIWCSLWLIPTTGTLAVLTWGLALSSDPFSVQGWLLRADWSGDMVALQSLMLVIAICQTIQTFMLMMTSVYIAKHLGGLLYLCIQFSKFVAWILCIYGTFFIIFGLVWADSAQPDGKTICYTFAVLGAIMVAQSFLGILASIKIWDDAHAAKKFYKLFWPSLIFTFFFNNGIFLCVQPVTTSQPASQPWTRVHVPSRSVAPLSPLRPVRVRVCIHLWSHPLVASACACFCVLLCCTLSQNGRHVREKRRELNRIGLEAHQLHHRHKRCRRHLQYRG